MKAPTFIPFHQGDDTMTDSPIVAQAPLWPADLLGSKTSGKRPNLHTLWLQPDHMPGFVTACPPAMRLLDLLGALHWDTFPERDLLRNWGQVTIPNAALIGAALLKLHSGLPTFGHLHQHLLDHPALIWLLGFPLQLAFDTPWGFNPAGSLPTRQHLTRMLGHLPQSALQFLLADSVRVIGDALTARQIAWGDCVSLDTKHVIAWVKENNPKAYVTERYNKARQPTGDPDCRLGCKRSRNQGTPPTPSHYPVPAHRKPVHEFYWGYGSGIVVTKIPGFGEFVLADFTQPFDHGDLTYFFPLMRDTELRLGHKPRFGTFDAAFDAWYVYAYFSAENGVPDGMAAVPFAEKGRNKRASRLFSPDGLPICDAGLPMPLHSVFTDRTTCLVEHQRGQYVCPITAAASTSSRRACPISHVRWPHGGCTAMMPISIGARLRYQIDRCGDLYKALYRQRTAVERINSQAVALGIERPHLRNGAAIANQNTLIYLLINLRFLQRLLCGQCEED
jgi:hypothetical protein